MNIFDSTFTMLEKSVNYSSKKNDVIVNNIANVDTPNYRAKDVTFQDMLQNSMQGLQAKRTHSKHIPFSNYKHGYITSQNNFMYNHNRNNVDIDKEMSKFAQNQIYYRSVVDRMNGKFNTLQTVIRGGK